MSLSFGIPTLDYLINPLHHASKAPATESIAILGPDGAGKSVLALHLASRYAANCNRLCSVERQAIQSAEREMPIILYVSSDLKEAGAKGIWDAFRLFDPDGRHIPFEPSFDMVTRRLSPKYQNERRLELKLKPLIPDESTEIADFILRNKAKYPSGTIGFLDLATHTAGDDWNFVNTLLVKLASTSTEKGKDGVPLPHLVIIDSVEGFETFVGRLDAYGNEQTRRSRVAQCIRNAGSRVQIVFVVEEPQSSEHLPEEYVTDVVLRLRKRASYGNKSLTIEVQKARGRDHAKGEHPLEIRPEEGTSTGNWENADTPRARNAYVQVFHSVAHRNRLISASWATPELNPFPVHAHFGLPFLDELLPDNGALKPGTATALIGDPATGKSSLGEKFIAEGFRDVVSSFVCLYLLRQDWAKFHKSKRIRQAFNSIHRDLSASILPDLENDEEPYEERELPDQFSTVTEVSWLACLIAAIHQGERATEERILGGAFEHGKEEPLGIMSGLDWRQRRETSKLALVERRQYPPWSRYAWVIDWDKLGEDHCLWELFLHPNLTMPGVLLTTSDRRGTDVAKRCVEYLDCVISQTIDVIHSGDKNLKDAITSHQDRLLLELQKTLDAQLIVRRFELEPLPAAAVFEVIQRNLAEANKLIYGLAYPSHQNARYYKAGKIRLVIDDLRVLANVNPEIVKDGSFLPFLSFVLERSGVVSLLIHMDSLRPNTPPQDDVTRALLSVLKSAILTWNVPFEGRRRIAIGVITPHREPGKSGLIRELTLSEGPRVTQSFEIYSGVEDGKPVPVPLAVYIFKETDAFGSYVEEEDKLFRELFTSVEASSAVNPGQIIFSVDAPRYLALRDYTHLALDAQDAHTMVFQVDEFWALKEPHILSDQEAYLGDKEDKGNNANDRWIEDPFRVFAGIPLSRPTDAIHRSGRYPRIEYFRNSGYEFENNSEKQGVYRIPFMWDFGFVLVRSAPWKMAGSEYLFASLNKEGLLSGGVSQDVLKVIESTIPYSKQTDVDEVLNELLGIKKNLKSEPQETEPDEKYATAGRTSWRKFFGACKHIADVHQRQTGAKTLPFDIASPSPETMNSILLEIWYSEIDIESQLLQLTANARNMLKKEKSSSLTGLLTLCSTGVHIGDDSVLGSSERPKTIKECFQAFKESHDSSQKDPAWRDTDEWDVRCEKFSSLPIGAFCLYKVWLLLLEVIEFEDFVDENNPFTFSMHRDPSIHSIASRHWYKTACSFSRQLYKSDGIHDSLVAMRMPGYYSTRGDWYLGSPRSSRSKLLAQHAIDLLCSRRANLTRLQKGLGLPVRDIARDKASREFRTALRCKMMKPVDGSDAVSEKTEISTEIKYGELIKLGADNKDHTFSWLRRSDISDYDRLGRPLQKWFVRLFHWTNDYKVRRSRQWTGGFPGYDQLTCKRFDQIQEYDSFVGFGELCDLLVEELTAAQRASQIE